MNATERPTFVFHPVYGERIAVEVEPDFDRDHYMLQAYGEGSWTIPLEMPVEPVKLFDMGDPIHMQDLRYFAWHELTPIGFG